MANTFIPSHDTSPITAVQEQVKGLRRASFGGGGKKCGACEKIVYPTEAVHIDGKTFHDRCFKCASDRCGKRLELGSCAAVDGTYYCKPHYNELFKLKGDYSTAFGKRSPSLRWSDKKSPKPEEEVDKTAQGETKRKLFVVSSSSQPASEVPETTPEATPAATPVPAPKPEPAVVSTPAPVEEKKEAPSNKPILPTLSLGFASPDPSGLPGKTPRTNRNQALKTPRVSTPRNTQDLPVPIPVATPAPAPTPAATPEPTPAPAPAPATEPAPLAKTKKTCTVCSVLLKPGSNCSAKQLKNKAPKCYTCAQISHETKKAMEAQQKGQKKN